MHIQTTGRFGVTRESAAVCLAFLTLMATATSWASTPRQELGALLSEVNALLEEPAPALPDGETLLPATPDEAFAQQLQALLSTGEKAVQGLPTMAPATQSSGPQSQHGNVPLSQVGPSTVQLRPPPENYTPTPVQQLPERYPPTPAKQPPPLPDPSTIPLPPHPPAEQAPPTGSQPPIALPDPFSPTPVPSQLPDPAEIPLPPHPPEEQAPWR